MAYQLHQGIEMAQVRQNPNDEIKLVKFDPKDSFHDFQEYKNTLQPALMWERFASVVHLQKLFDDQIAHQATAYPPYGMIKPIRIGFTLNKTNSEDVNILAKMAFKLIISASDHFHTGNQRVTVDAVTVSP
ncbi:MAG: hypothetical protein MMC33_002110 [Icmadophila ericetorum]|nr:hypothetical protein [Icmadophila ericetorum]